MSDVFVKKVLSGKITLYSRGNDVNYHYHYYFRLNRKTYRGTTHTNNLDDSEEYSIVKYNEIKNNKGKQQKTITFRECLNKFFEYKKTKLKPTTLQTYETHSRFLLEYFKKIDPNTIDTDTYKNYEDWRRKYFLVNPEKNVIKYKRNNSTIKMKKKPHTVGDVLINREIGLLRNILQYCFENNLLSIKTIPKWEPLDEKRREETITKEEYEKLKRYFLKTNPYYWSICSFLQNTGLRYPSELNELKWKDINLDKSFMIIRNRKGRKNSDKKWSVPIVGTSKKILMELKNRDIPTNPEDYVFVNNQGKRVLNIKRSFQKGLLECGITKPLCMYSWRHTFCTRIVSTRPDIPLKILAETMGHLDVRMIDRHYGHLRPETLVNYFKKSEDKRQQILKKRKQKELDDIEI